jgi:HEPN domain-containing protein
LAEYDLETARHMLVTGRYLYVIFLCHLALEKMLKAHVTETIQEFPAKTRDLIYLVKKGKVVLPQNLLEFTGRINTASIPTRYPEDLQLAIQEYPESVAREYLENTEKVIKWLKEHLNPS